MSEHVACKIGLLVEYFVTLWAGETVLGQNGFSTFMENPVVISQVPLPERLRHGAPCRLSLREEESLCQFSLERVVPGAYAARGRIR